MRRPTASCWTTALRRVALMFGLTLALVAPAAGVATASKNPVDAQRFADKPIDAYRYDYAHKCLDHPQKGALALVNWLERNAAGSFWGIMRCEKLSSSSYSLHSEGRAIDWRLDVHDKPQKRAAKRLIALFLARDKFGNNHALARRMGIQELIWNCHAWWSGDGGMRRYSPCYDSNGHRRTIDDTTAHRNHIHIGMNWRGARKKSSFWRH